MKAGTLLGAYEIREPLGSGGQGEVYRARDTRLGRDVAVKILSENVASDPARRARFEREARAVAALNHPNIATLYDVGTTDGIDFLVMELVEGETLAERLKRGPLPRELALTIAGQIADALDKAHRKGIVHRDLKPANVMLTSGKHPQVKLLDFGLARLRQGFGEAGPEESDPTAAQPLTREGVLLGTLQYMAPEQLERKDADARCDLWALGAVLYEMLTGRKALTRTPESIVSISPGTPRQLEHVLERCLARDPDERWQTASDVLRELKWAETTSSEPVPSPGVKPGRSALVATVAALSGLVLGFALKGVFSPAPPRVPVRVTIPTPPMTRMVRPAIAISRNGERIAFLARDRIWIRDLRQLDARPVPGTEGAENPFFSPDGEWLGFFAGGQLHKVSLQGGLPIALTPKLVFLPRGAFWQEDDRIVFGHPSALMRVSAAGGEPETVVAAERASHPQTLRGGRAVLYTILEEQMRKLVVRALPEGEPRVLVEGANGGRVLPTGHLVYFQSGTLFAVRFDPEKLALAGNPVPVVNDIRASRYAAHFDVSEDGTLLYWRGSTAERRFVWVDREGREEPLNLRAGDYGVVNLSPDGTKAAFDDDADVWLYDLTTDTLARFTFEDSIDTDPVWSHDGAQIFFSSDRDGARNVYVRPSDGSGKATRLTESAAMQWPQSVTPDGEVLFIDVLEEETIDILQLNWRTETEPRPFLRTTAYERLPGVSPDGRFVVYETIGASEREIDARTYVEGGGPWQVSNEGGRAPRWSPDGRDIFYLEDGALFAVEVETEPSFRVVGRRRLFEGPYADNSHSYDVSRDGKRFLMLREGGTAGNDGDSGLVIVLDWFEELKRLVP